MADTVMENTPSIKNTSSKKPIPQLSKDEVLFVKFPELPIEIRLQIWEEAFPLQKARRVKFAIPMDVEIPGEGSTDIEWEKWREQMTHCAKISPSPPPPLFLVCRESREIALRFTKRYCGAIPFIPRIDTMYLPGEIWNPRIRHGIIEQIHRQHGLDDIRYLALDMATMYENMYQMWNQLRGFKNLETVFLVVPGSTHLNEEMFSHFRQVLQGLRAKRAFLARKKRYYVYRRYPMCEIQMVGLEWLNA